ncbi:MAG TPA: AmmeMemoRadiSam system protein B [Terriglobia bacterium]
MKVRKPAAPHFYAGDCAHATRQFLEGFTPPEEPAHVVAGIVPHAGWQYSGAVAAKIFESIRRKQAPDTFVIFGAVHRWSGSKNALCAEGAWATPLGEVSVDEELASRILEAMPEWAADDPAAHTGEHAIEVQLPFLKCLFPEAKFVPISVNPEPDAALFGERVGQILKRYPRCTVVIGSTDLTHYGDAYRFVPAGYGARAQQWVRENDRRIVRLAERMEASEIVPEAIARSNACGPGAMAATVAAAEAMGARRGVLVEYKTSFDSAPEPEFRMAVGYAGLLF